MKFLEEYEAYLRKLDRSTTTIRGYLSDLNQFQSWLGKDRSLASLQADDVRAYRDHLFNRRVSPSTMSRHLASLASFGQWGTDKAGLFPENPALYIEPVQVAALAPRWLDRSQRRRLLKVIEDDLRLAREKYPRLWLLRFRDAVMVHTLLNTGLRVGELCDVLLSDLTIGERKGSILVRSGKGRKQRSVALMNETRKELAEWLKIRPQTGTDHVFIGQQGEPIRPRIVQRVVARYAREAGLEDVTPHTLRHTFAKSLLDSNASLVEVARLMGHQSLDSTARYTQPSEAELQDAVERLGDVSD